MVKQIEIVNSTVPEYKDVEKEMADILNRSETLRESFTKLCSEDVSAYKNLSCAFKLPKETATEKQERKMKVQQALKEAIAVPAQVCKDAHEAIKLCLPLAQKGNVNLITDTAIASIMLKCTFQSALLNVEINLKSIKDEEFDICGQCEWDLYRWFTDKVTNDKRETKTHQ